MRSWRKKQHRKVRVVTYNLGNSSDARVTDDLNKIKDAGAQIIGLQEHGDRDALTERWVDKNSDWDKWAGDGRPGGAKTSILYERSFGKVTLEKSDTLSTLKHVPQGAGPERTSPKVSNRVRWRVGRKVFHFVVGHQYATVHNRKVAAATFMRALVRVIKPRRGTVVAVGDWNDTDRGVAFRMLRCVFTDVSKVGGTHERREIDRILVKRGRITNSWKMQLSSDHDAVFADIEF